MTVDAAQPPLSLCAGTVDIWLTFLSDLDSSQQRAFEQVLSEGERARWHRFICPAAKLQYLASRALLRSTLERYTGVPHHVWQFATTDYGRPYILQPSSFRFVQFNLSHTNGLVACAVTKDQDLGVDVEDSHREIDIAALAPTVFASHELDHFFGAPPALQREIFFSYWTLKEAYIKSRGMGLSIDLKSFWFDIGSSPPRVHFTHKCPDDPFRWQFRQYAPSDRHRLALATSPPRPRFDVRLRRVIPLSKV